MNQNAPLDLRSLKIGAILNTASGSCTPESEHELKTIFEECDIPLMRTWCVDSEGLPGALKDFEEEHLDVLVVLGGDGTIRSAAERCTEKGPLLVPLPGGTMNVLPKALYGDGSWKEILRRVLTRAQVRQVSGGEVAGKQFFISAICGAPALWANAREALRAGSASEVIEQGKIALEHMFSRKVQYHFDDMHEGEAEAVVVSCPLVSDAMEDDRRALEAAIFDVNDMGEVIALATAAAFGKWRETEHVAVVRTTQVRISTHGKLPLILDGEETNVGSEADISFREHAFNALVPADEILS